MIRHLLIFMLCLPAGLSARAPGEPEFSRAGFFTLPESGREAADFNLGWRFRQGDVQGAEARDFNDAAWQRVSTPHGVDSALPEETSGSSNYQGPAWYRKTFTPPVVLAGKRVDIHFEGILGKSKIWLNGKLLREHYSGFLPAIVDVTDIIELGKPNVVAVLADNSDDPTYPPGKPQKQLDFSYLGGIYRDVWLVSTSPVRITDANAEDEIAGGGVFFHTAKIDEREATASVKIEVGNGSEKAGSFAVNCELTDPKGSPVASATAALDIPAASKSVAKLDFTIGNPQPWTPDSPVLHWLKITVRDTAGNIVDGYRVRVGLRTIRFFNNEGLVLNGKPFPGKLIGTNRHQDHAVIGFAMTNNLHWRDVKKLRDAGLRVLRNAHYPQDPAFMDACNELGMLVIVNTPGWQFWNDAPEFGRRVYSDIRNMVRRDRNHPAVLLWEPILNETSYPAEFAATAQRVTHAEYPYPGCYTGADSEAMGSEHFEVQFAHPRSGDGLDTASRYDSTKAYFTREWGDNVDDWGAQNSPSRVARHWGEMPQLLQAEHYAKPPYPYSSLDSLYRAGPEHFGGTFWHGFDHQRGYHPDPFLGGIMDAFRRPKYAYEMFRAHRPASVKLPLADSGPTVFVANAMTPFSPANVTVYSNCEVVRLSVHGKPFGEMTIPFAAGTRSHLPLVVFEKAFDFMAMKRLCREFKQDSVQLMAEGLIDGKVVCSHVVRHAERAVKIGLSVDNAGQPVYADGSTVIPMVATLEDENGVIKRLNDGAIGFEISGPAEIVGDVSVSANPKALKWGEAPLLVRVGATPGKIRVIARFVPAGDQMPRSGVLELETLPAPGPFIHDEIEDAEPSVQAANQASGDDSGSLKLKLEAVEKELNLLRNREVERQQSDFEKTN